MAARGCVRKLKHKQERYLDPPAQTGTSSHQLLPHALLRPRGARVSMPSETPDEAFKNTEACHPELQRRFHLTQDTQHSNMDADSISRQQEETNEKEGYGNSGNSDDELYDSLEVPEPTQENAESTGISKIQPMLQKVSSTSRRREDEYADLRYDPNWKAGFEQLHNERNHLFLLENRHLDLRNMSGKGLYNEEGEAAIREQGNSSWVPALTFTPGVSGQHWELNSKMPTAPYLPLQQEHTVDHADLHTSEYRSPRLAPEGAPAKNSYMGATENPTYSDEQLVKMHFNETGGRFREQNQFSEQKYMHDNKTFKKKQDTTGPKMKNYRFLATVKEAKLKQDIVERNKLTLGMNTPKQGSYLLTHENKAEKSCTKKNKTEPREKVASASSQEDEDDALDAEQRWQRRTQKLKIAQGCNAKKGQKAERNNHNPQDKRQNLPRPLAQVHRNSESVNPISGTSQWSKQSAIDLQPNHLLGRQGTPTVNLNINLNTPPDAMSFLGQEAAQHGVSTSHNPLGRARPQGICHLPAMGPHLNLWLTPSQVISYYNPGLAPQIPALPSSDKAADQHELQRLFLQQNYRGINSGGPLFLDQGSSSFRSIDPTKARVLPAKWQHAADQNVHQNLGNLHVMQQYDNCRHSPGVTPPSSRLYAVLPPIGQKAGSSAERGSQSSGQQANTLRRSISEGYLAKLEKQKQLKERTGYKAYTLKDYRSLQKDIKLGGLGPNYKITEMTAEKMKRQKEYSNAVREQNKKISRDPSLGTRHPVDKDNKDVVSRMKALEYARNIPKPKVPPQQKNREVAKKENFIEQVQYLEDLDTSQLATLEMLWKRHEEEKRAIAHFRVPQVI
ncbi:hypothetical protein GN956_G24595 [Arapaima gigas]